MKLTGAGYSSATFTADALITQTIGIGSTAVGRVVSYDETTGVLKYWQDRSLAGFNTAGGADTNRTIWIPTSKIYCQYYQRWFL